MMIPVESMKHHIAVLGKTGSGKTYTAKSELVERILDLGLQVAIVDPTSAWWGLRLDPSGKKPSGFDVMILGGPHGDLPLTDNMGEACARILTEQLVSVVFDTSLMTVGERTRWFTAFAIELYRTIKQPMTLVLDEVHNFCPQGKVPDPATGKMLHAANQLFSGGRSRGIRLVGISQRPAKWHKDALTSVDTLVVHRLLAPQDREAVKAWIDGCGDARKGREVLDSLANLKRGEAWVWFPEGSVLHRKTASPICTFDSSATPEHGRSIATVQAIDLELVKARLAEAVKHAEENDPRRLRARIEQLESDLAAAMSGGKRDPDAGGMTAMQAEIDRLEEQNRTFADALRQAGEAYRELVDRGDRIRKFVMELTIEVPRPPMGVAATDRNGLNAAATTATRSADTGGEGIWVPPPRPIAERHTAATRANGAKPAASRAPSGSSAGLSGPELRILEAMSACLAMRLVQPPRSLVAACARYSPTSTSFTKALGSLRQKGLIEYPGAESAELTQAGRDKAPIPTPFGSLAELHQQVLAIVTGPERRVLSALLQAGQHQMQRATAASRAGYSPTSTSFTKALSSLRTKGFIDYPDSDTVRPTAMLFPPSLKR